MTQRYNKHLDFFGLCMFLATCLFVAVDPILNFGLYVNDFRGYYAAAYVFRHGGNPYDYSQIAEALLSLTGYIGNNPFYYPPWLAWAFVPFTYLPFRISFLVWNTINLMLWFVGLRQIRMLLHLPWEGWRLYSLYFVVTLSFAWVTFRYGQIGFLLMALFLAAVVAFQREQWIWGGLCLALCLVKPNITLVPVGMLCLWLLLRRVWKPALIVILINAALLIASLVMMPNWYQPLTMPHAFDGITYDTDGPGKQVRDRINPTMLDVMSILSVDRRIAVVLYSVSVIMGTIILGVSLRYMRSLLEITLVSTTFWLFLTPYAQTYDYMLLVIVFSFLISIKLNPLLLKIVGLCIVSIAPLFGTTPLNSYLMVVVLTALLAVYYVQNWKFDQRNPLILPTSAE